jgi:hypothetical protein
MRMRDLHASRQVKEDQMGREWLACLRPSVDRFETCQSQQAVGVVAIHLRALLRQPLCDLPPSEARVLLGFVTNLPA